MSAFGSGELERRVVSLKNAVFVAKPVEPSTLARLTNEALARRGAPIARAVASAQARPATGLSESDGRPGRAARYA